MSIVIVKADIKRKCMISDTETAYDTKIDALIAEMQPSVEYTIADTYLNDTANTRLQAILKLGIVEMISGEFLQQLSREAGASGELSIGGFSMGSGPDNGAKLIKQGTERLRPFRKPIDGLSDENPVSSTTERIDRVFTNDSMKVW